MVWHSIKYVVQELCMFSFLNSACCAEVTYNLHFFFFAVLTNAISSYLADATQRQPQRLLLSLLFIFRGNC